MAKHICKQTTDAFCVINGNDLIQIEDDFWYGGTIYVGTTCPQGGDTGHGGRTLIRFEDPGSMDIKVYQNKYSYIEEHEVDKDSETNETEHIFGGFDIALGGDWECRGIINLFRKIADALETQLKKNKEKFHSL